MIACQFGFELPVWLVEKLKENEITLRLTDEKARMAFVIELSRLNVTHQSGGPFAAAVFEQHSGRLISVGVNLVEKAKASSLHAEVVALTLAQKGLGQFSLEASSANAPSFQLVSSAEPCAMCLGAIPWSGVRSVLTGARDEDVRNIGFDEGDKPLDWQAGLAKRGISVTRDLLRPEAVSVLRLYQQNQGLLYNGK
jgi:tRNA(Arg) A34 adenosine deaminase TadA